ncbi:MAG: ATP-binding protein [Pseudomonadota bacterium]
MGSALLELLVENLAASPDPWPEVIALIAKHASADAGVLQTADEPARRLACYGVPDYWLNEQQEKWQHSGKHGLGELLRQAGFAQAYERTLTASDMAIGRIALAWKKEQYCLPSLRATLDEAAPIVALGMAARIRDDRVVERSHVAGKLAELARLASVGAVARAIAHELALPLTSLLMIGGDLRDRLKELAGMLPNPGPGMSGVLEELQALAADCVESSDRARVILNDFRLGLQPGEIGSAARTTSIGETLGSALRLVSPLARNLVRMDVCVEPNLPPVSGSQRRLEQAFANLLTNAIQAAVVREAGSGAVKVAARRAGDEIVVEIADNGPGMTFAIKQRIFEPFFTTRQRASAAGLGLPISREIIEAHGGRIEVESEPGRGASFAVVLPTYVVAPRPSPMRQRPRILVVEDDPVVLRTMLRVLGEGFDFIGVENGERALAILGADSAFDVLIVNLADDTTDGPDFYRAVQASAPGLERRIIFSTAASSSCRPAVRDFLAGIPNRRFEKPIAGDTLWLLIRTVFETS